MTVLPSFPVCAFTVSDPAENPVDVIVTYWDVAVVTAVPLESEQVAPVIARGPGVTVQSPWSTVEQSIGASARVQAASRGRSVVPSKAAALLAGADVTASSYAPAAARGGAEYTGQLLGSFAVHLGSQDVTPRQAQPRRS